MQAATVDCVMLPLDTHQSYSALETRTVQTAEGWRFTSKADERAERQHGRGEGGEADRAQQRRVSLLHAHRPPRQQQIQRLLRKVARGLSCIP